MDKEKLNLYNDLVDRWSRLFKKKFGKLMEYDDIKQEAWVAILSAEEYDKEFESTYLGHCIKNHLNRLLLDTIYRNRVESLEVIEDITPDTHFSNPERVAIASDLAEKLEINIRKIPHGMFVWKRMDRMTIRDISKEGKELGLPLSPTNVHKIITRIRGEFKKVAGM